jgi:hypothetical protein
MPATVALPRGGYALDPVSALDTATRAHAGAAGNRSGERFEEMLNRAHLRYAHDGVAVIAAVGEKTRGAPGNVRRTASGLAPDFVGLVTVNGAPRPVAFDAKGATGKAKLTIAVLAPKLDPRDVRRIRGQVAWLMRFAEAGGIAFYACLDAECAPDGGAVFLVPASALAPLLNDDGEVPVRAIVGRGADRRIETPHRVVYPTPLVEVARGRPFWDWARVLAEPTPT